MKTQLDYTKLHQFHYTLAKQGEPVCTSGCADVDYVDGPDTNGKVCIMHPDNTFELIHHENLRMCPLFWVDGVPIYGGDWVYSLSGFMIDGSLVHGPFMVHQYSGGTVYALSDTTNGISVGKHIPLSDISLTNPKKKTVNLLAYIMANGILREFVDGSESHNNAVAARLARVPNRDSIVVIE